jgi:hypothetical protein
MHSASLTSRFRRRARHALTEPSWALRRLVSPLSYIDRHRPSDPTVMVLSTARSGSTLLAETLVRDMPLRLIFEPLKRNRAVPWGVYVAPDGDDPAVTTTMDRAVTGRVRSIWTDKHNHSHWPSGRVIKEIRGTNLAPWMVKHYPEVPLIYLIRNPIATAMSYSALGWDNHLGDFLGQESLLGGPLHQWRRLIEQSAAQDNHAPKAEVLRWCMENVVPITMLRHQDAHVVFFEDLVQKPEEELSRLATFLRARQPQVWDDWRPDIADLLRPSPTTFGGWNTDSPNLRISGWQRRIDPDRFEQCQELVAAFGLEGLYGDSPDPLVRPEQLLGR